MKSLSGFPKCMPNMVLSKPFIFFNPDVRASVLAPRLISGPLLGDRPFSCFLVPPWPNPWGRIAAPYVRTQ